MSGLALALGPVIGGLLVGAGGWRWVFWFNLLLALVLLVAVVATVPESRDPQPGRLDLPGVVLGVVGIGAAIYAAISGEYRGFGTWWIVTLFVVAGLCLIAFVRVELRARSPMLDLRLVRRPIVGSALFAAFAVYFGVFAIFFFTALYLDIGQSYSGWRLAGMFAPMAVAIAAGGIGAGPWVARRGTRVPTVVGCLVGAAGMVLARVELGEGRHLSFALLALALAVAGLGFGVTVVPLTSAVLTHIPAARSGMAASATNTARQLGAVVGVAALGAIINAHLTSAVNAAFSDPTLSKIGGGKLKEQAVSVLETGGSSGSFDLRQLVTESFFQPFVKGFLDGLQLALLVATVLAVLAAAVAAVVREPAPEPAEG